MFLLLIPALLFSQQQSAKKDTTKTVQKAVTNQVTFTNDGKLRFPDNTVQETAYPGNAQSQGNPPNIEILNNGVKFPDGTTQTTAYIPNTNPPPALSAGVYIQIDHPGFYGNAGNPQDGIIELGVFTGGIDREVVIGGQQGSNYPAFSEVSIIGMPYYNAPAIKELMASGDGISNIEIFVMAGNGPYKTISYKYTNCYISSCNVEMAEFISSPTELSTSFTFKFERVCYCARAIEDNGSTIFQSSSCYDVKFNQGCSCSCPW